MYCFIVSFIIFKKRCCVLSLYSNGSVIVIVCLIDFYLVIKLERPTYSEMKSKTHLGFASLFRLFIYVFCKYHL